MGKKKWKSSISLFLAAVLAVTSIGMANPLTADAAKDTENTASAEGRAVTGDNATYYIDAKDGNDNNDGKSEEKAWKSFEKVSELRLVAGGKVLLKAGCTWNDQKLMINEAKGTKENPVVLGKYGDGANPVINGNGSNWLDNMNRSILKKEDVAAVHVKNSEYITVENLEVTNWERDKADLEGIRGTLISNNDSPGRRVAYDQSKYMLTGILVENHDAGELSGVIIKNNYVHDVNGYMSQNGREGDKKGSGGIMVLVTGGETESYFKDLEILGNEVNKVCHEAIYMESCWAARKLVGGADSQQAGDKPWVGWPNVHVKDNYVHDVAGDGIVLINTDGGVAERNLLVKCASEDWSYSRNPAHAAIWAWDCNNATFQNNEAAYTESTQDGMAFDSDYGNQNILFQYNYSHDNKGGFWMACPGPYYSINSVVRYNVSVNDGRYDGARVLKVGESGSIGHQVYNNTIYWDDTYKDIVAVEQASWISGNATPYTSGTDIYNNIIYGDSAAFANHDGVRYHSNCVWGGAEKAYPWEEDSTGFAADPGLKNVTQEGYSTGTFDKTTRKVTLGSTEGFELTAASPCIDAGESYMEVPNESFEAVADEKLPNDKTQITLENKDYKGNAVPYQAGAQAAATEKTDIGAFEHHGAYTGSATASEEDKDWLQKMITQAEGLDKTKFETSSVEKLEAAVADAKTALQSKPALVKTMVYRMENILMNMDRKGEGGVGTPADSVLTEAQSTFESGTGGWGHWPDAVSVTDSAEQKRSGSKSLKIDYANAASDTAFSELGGVLVQPNTEYVFEAWVYYTGDASKVELQAKHHNGVTSDKKDHALGNADLTKAEADTEHEGWYKATLKFTTEGYSTASIIIASNLTTVYMDDVALYPAQRPKTKLDLKTLETALAKVPEYAQSEYPTTLWEAYSTAYDAARLMRVNAAATQGEVNRAASLLNAAYRNLAKKASNLGLLRAYYTTHASKKKGNYTDASWTQFEKALQAAKDVLALGDQATQMVSDKALKDLKAAVNELAVNPPKPPVVKKDQTISVQGTFAKTFGDKVFSLGVKRTGDGALTYKSSSNSVATVDNSGKVTIKGTGSCIITITAAGTANYNAKSVNVTITVKPKKMSIKGVTAAKKSLKVTWKKDSKATGYEIQCSLTKNFKKVAAKADVTVKKTSATLKKLKKGKKYYVRIRAYKTATVNGKKTKLTGAWSKVKTSKKVK